AKTIEDIDKLAGENVNYKKLKSFHAIILATNYVGLKKLIQTNINITFGLHIQRQTNAFKINIQAILRRFDFRKCL
ncbi:hypothetical protein OBE_11494, partial [human gut metagenome]